MSENRYWMEGTFTLDDATKKKEMNDLILQVLRKTGIGRLTTKTVSGKKIEVFEQAKVDKNGIIKFNYSKFEKIKRKGNYYNTRTCELVTPDRGYNHFGVTMNCIMVILESYSQTPYFIMNEEKLEVVDTCIQLVFDLTGFQLDFPIRANAFRTCMYFKNNDKYKDFNFEIEYYPYGCVSRNWDNLFFTSELDKPITKTAEVKSESDKDRELAYLCLEFMQKQDADKQASKDDILAYIKMLMDMPLEQREMEAKKDTVLSVIAGISEFLHGPYLVKIYAQAFDLDFYDVWNQIAKEGYWDVKGNKISTAVLKQKHLIKKFYQFDFEDDFIGLWNHDDMILSQDVESDFLTYKSEYSKLKDEDLEDVDAVDMLIACIEDLDAIWNTNRYIDKDLFEEIMINKADLRYKKAVYTLRTLIDNEIELFSELTESQVRVWLLKKVNWKRCANLYWHYLDVLSNHIRRKELLGF